jgi:hypothetical protein
MTEFPLLPRHSRIIVEAILKYPDLIHETVIAAAFLSTQSPYLLPPGEEMDARKAHHGFRDKSGDFVSYLKLYRAFTESANKQKFCEKNYLDERAMAEIANVAEQLGQIVTDMKIPITDGAWPLSTDKTEDYLCAIGKGHVQFVCVREGRDLYRSLTADRILIHPGPVMFRRGPGEPPPEFIVAGEIVRTARMYAMSVSPLSRSALDKIDPGLFTALGGYYREDRSGEKPRSRKLMLPRDFTNNIKIGSEIFEIDTFKGKKEARLPWEKLKGIREKIINGQIQKETLSFYKGLRGTIIVDDKYKLLKGEKLSLILTLLPSLSPELNPKILPHAQYDSRENLDKLLEQLSGLGTPALWKKHGKGQNANATNELGFSGLFTDGEGNYRIKCCRGFHTSLNESIASLETLIDELGDDVDIGKKHIVNQCYRRLSDLVAPEF